MKQVILTGDRPTERLHVGHYVGSLKERVRLQNSGKFDEIYIMIADAQALTDNAEHPEKVRQNIMQVALDYLACGLDPEKVNIFIQSMVPELTELSFYYMNLVTVARVQRNPTVKAEIKQKNFEASIPVGFFTYPISQAADITAFRATVVPAGEDQMPMVEQCKEIVHKFNSVYGETLTDPQIVLPDNQACLRLPGIDGKAKMSKSLGNCIYLSEEPDEIKKKVEEAAKILDLEKLLDRKPKALSGGQRQRVAMGRAIVRNPKVFLMDEPLSNLDAKLRVQMRSEIASLHNRLKATIIYVTHDQTEAMTLGTRIVVLKDGVIMQVDSPQKLYNEPNNLFVAGFIGSPQMNFIDAVCKVEGERVTLNFEKTSVVLPPAKAKKLIDGGYNGKTVVMGIRPEDIGDSQIEIEAHKDAVFETDVTGYELLGSEVLLYFNVAGTAMTAKVDSRTTARMGDHITLAIDPEKIHCFDKETELTITN